jgi:hypothetical protein
LETEIQNFKIELKGTSISAQMEADESKKDFGVIGLGFAETRDIRNFF